MGHPDFILSSSKTAVARGMVLGNCAGGFLGYSVGEIFAEESQGGEYGSDEDGERHSVALGEKTADIGEGVLEAKAVARGDPIRDGNESQKRHGKADKCGGGFRNF